MLSSLKSLKNLICVLVIILCSVLCNASFIVKAEAADKTDVVAERKTVRLGYLIAPGYQEGVGPSEPKQGFGYDYYQKVAYLTGWHYEYVYGNFAELLDKLKKGEIDMMGNLSYTPERAKDIFFGSEEMGRESFCFYTKVKNMDSYVHGLVDFNNKTIGVNKASFQAKLLEKWLKDNGVSGVKIIHHNSKQERYDYLNKGLSDLAVSTVISHRDDQNSDWLSVGKLGEAPFYIGISKKRPDLLEELNIAQRHILAVNPEFNTNNYNKYMHGVSISGSYVSKQEKEWLTKHPVIKVGYLSDFAPYSWINPEKKMEGVLALVLDKFEKNYGIKTERIAFTNARDLLKAIKERQIDVMAPGLGSVWRSEQDGISLTASLMQRPMLLVYNGKYRKGLTNRIAITDCNAAGTVYAYNYLKKAKLVHFWGIPKACQGLLDGEADAIITMNDQYELMRKRFPEIRELNSMPLPNDMYIRFGTGYAPELLSLLNKNLSILDRAEIDNYIVVANDIPKKYTWKEQLLQNIGGVTFSVLALLGLIFGGGIWYMRVVEEKNRVLTEAKENAERMLLQEQTLRKQLEEARHEADHDGLTGLWNKGSFDNLLRMYHSSRNIAIMVVDFDDFKSINDNHGHDVGDKVLKYVASSIEECFRTSDYVCRIGGDEFAVIMTNITSEQREIVEEKITRIQQKIAAASEELPKISVSIGCAFSDRNELKDAREIFRHADKALYSVKHKGKNNYAFFN